MSDAITEEANRESCLAEGFDSITGSGLDLYPDTGGRLGSCTATDLVRSIFGEVQDEVTNDR